MKTWLLAVALVAGFIGPTGMAYVGAQAVIAQERHTPEGEWCQRPMAAMSKKAHACACHTASCTDPDPDHLPAHIDAMCLSYCRVTSCKCPKADCP